MQPQQKLTDDEKIVINRNIQIAKDTLAELINYERVGADVSLQRTKLQEVIDKGTKLLEVFGN